MGDSNWNNGFYYDGPPPYHGMKLARQLATITYRSGPEWQKRFGLERIQGEKEERFSNEFSIEDYIDHQGDKFCRNYDANSWLYLSRAMDLFDLSYSKLLALKESSKLLKHAKTKSPRSEKEDLIHGLSTITMPSLILGVQSDILFPCFQQKQISDYIKASGNHFLSYYELDSIYGHDTFLIDTMAVGSVLKGHLEQI